MMSLPDFREKSILVFRAENDLDQKLKFKNQNIVFEKEDATVVKFSTFRILAIFIMGDFSLTTKLIDQCQKHGISIFLLKKNLTVYADICAEAKGNVLLRQKQYQLSLAQELFIAKRLVDNKLRNQSNLLRYINIEEIQKQPRKEYRKKQTIKINEAVSLQELLGLEGTIARTFFENYYSELNWKKRLPRTKLDEINYLLDLGYTFLFNYIESIATLFGFDVYKGVYHQVFYKRKSLICDIMEPFRCIIDKAILKNFRLQKFNKTDFEKNKNQYTLPYKITNKYTQAFLEEILNYKEDIFCYIRNYYYYILNGEGHLPAFIIR